MNTTKLDIGYLQTEKILTKSMKIQTSEIMGRRNNKKAMNTHNPTITEPGITEMLRSSEEQIRKLIGEMIEDFQKEFRESQKEIKETINEMETSIQTINNRLDHMEGRVSLLKMIIPKLNT